MSRRLARRQMQCRALVFQSVGSPLLLLLRTGSCQQAWLQRCTAAGQFLGQLTVTVLSTRMSALLQCHKLLRLAVQALRMP